MLSASPGGISEHFLVKVGVGVVASGVAKGKSEQERVQIHQLVTPEATAPTPT